MLKNFEDVQRVLTAYVPPVSDMHKNYKLDRVRQLMDKLGNPQDKYKVIHVAGTSGKSSTCYYMAALLSAAGKKVGLTVSPHIDEVNERVQINLRPLPEADFCRKLGVFIDIVEKTGIKPSYFEVLIAFAYWEFARSNVDYAVVEVGIGGLLDATNVVNRSDKVCVITDIGLDHTHVLGNTLGEIAKQKAGIIQTNNKVVTYHAQDDIRQVLRQVAAQKHADLVEVSIPPDYKLPASLPQFQKRNWYLAYEAYTYLIGRDGLPVLNKDVLMATARTYVPARMEIIDRDGKIIVLDGAHNQQKMQVLSESLKERFNGQPIATLLAIVNSEDFRLRTDLATIIGISNYLIITSFGSMQDFPKVSVDPELVNKHCRQLGYDQTEVIKKPEDALRQLLQRPEPVLLVTGSFYLMNHIRPQLLNKP